MILFGCLTNECASHQPDLVLVFLSVAALFFLFISWGAGAIRRSAEREDRRRKRKKRKLPPR